ncbi:IS3 family transposase [Alkalihalophilus marmarensis]|uniref:IS3 family transposase n=1 Tax=Alkalihalophilus marmarensis TaxID=521377 RepID=UPI003B75BAFE
MKSFFKTLKYKKYYLNKYKTFNKLSFTINKYIHFYNHKKYQKQLNNLNPIKYKTKTT